MPNCGRAAFSHSNGSKSIRVGIEELTGNLKGHIHVAEYYSVINRAVAALETDTFEDRRAIYNRARAAQLKQLANCACNKTDFDRERSMLEDAIARVETQAANNRNITYASPNASVKSTGLGPTRLRRLGPVRSWLKSVLRFWGR
jgi:hypothetical protein